jgi:putative FmdB family regulatory protein
MAIYEYRCRSCGNQFEVMKSIKDDSLPVCTVCGADQVEKLISHSSFILKGKGWYSTDYGSGGSSKSHSSGCGCCSSSSSCPAPAAETPAAPCAGGACAAAGSGSHD